jgi:hypothetical protein
MRLFPALRKRLTNPGDVRTLLWAAGALMALPIVTVLIANAFLPNNRAVTWDMLGHDFLALYYGGHCALTGHYEQLYDLPATKAFEYSVGHAAGLSLGKSFGPWWNPPFAAWLFAPFAALPYMSALHAWWSFCALCLVGSMILLGSMFRGGWRTRMLIPLFLLTSMPCIQAFCHGQNTQFSLLLLTTTVWLWRKDRPLLAGLVCGLLFYKPQLGAAIAAVLCFTQGRRALLGVCLTGASLLLINILTMPGSLHEFLHQMPLNLNWIQEQNTYLWERHVTFKSFWRFMFQGNAMGPTKPVTLVFWMLSEFALAAGLARVAFKSLGRGISASQRDRLIATTIASMPLLMPFYFDYDLLLLAVAIVVYCADRQHTPGNREDRWLVWSWSLVFLVLTFWKLPYIPTVPLLTIGAVLLIRRALRSDPPPAIAYTTIFPPTSIAA